MEFDSLSTQVIGCAIEVHRVLGPGLLESTYEECLSHELTVQGLSHQRQLMLPVTYKGLTLPCSYRVDLLVDGQLVVEIKSVDQTKDVHLAQLLTYMRLSEIRVGLLINFNVRLLKQGIRRVVL